MSEYHNGGKTGVSNGETACGPTDGAAITGRGRGSAKRRRRRPKSKEELYMELVAANLSAFDEPETRYCPDDLTLAGFMEETLEEREQERVRLHVKVCKDCREVMDEVSIATAPDANAVIRGIQRRKRLHELIDMALKCVGGSRVQLAKLLDCDVAHIYPDTGRPDLEFVGKLAGILDWSVETVSDFIDTPEPAPCQSEDDTEFKALDSAIYRAIQNCQHEQTLRLTRRAAAVARRPEERALSCLRAANEYNALGQYGKALEAHRRALRETGISDSLRRLITVNLANALYTLGGLDEARALAEAVMRWFRDPRPSGRRDRGSRGFAYYVRGSVFCRQMEESDGEDVAGYARRARHDLRVARWIFFRLHKEGRDSATGGIANTCLGGVIAAEVALGKRDPRSAVNEFLKGAVSVDDPGAWPRGDWLESFGWWCVFGAHIALRYLPDGEWKHDAKALIDRGLRIADRLGNWSMRERLFSIRYRSCRSRCDDGDGGMAFEVDQEQLRLIVGTMGRFPAFRQLGLEIISEAKLVDRVR